MNATTRIWSLVRAVRTVADQQRPTRWLFARGDQTIELITRSDADHHYVAAIRWPNGRQEMWRFLNVGSMLQHVFTLVRQFGNSDFRFTGVCVAGRQHD